MTKHWQFQPINRSQVIDALKEFGPMTRYEIADHLGWDVKKVGTTIGSTRHLKPGLIFRIVSYVQDTPIVVARYAAEPGADAPMPRINFKKRKIEAMKRWREKNVAITNAKARIKLAEEAGRIVAINPWMQLAHTSLRSLMSQAVQL